MNLSAYWPFDAEQRNVAGHGRIPREVRRLRATFTSGALAATQKGKSRMKMNCRQLLQLVGGACSSHAMSEFASAQSDGPFAPTREPLRADQLQERLRDARIGNWSHRRPQSAIEDGDWYALNMGLGFDFVTGPNSRA